MIPIASRQRKILSVDISSCVASVSVIACGCLCCQADCERKRQRSLMNSDEDGDLLDF